MKSDMLPMLFTEDTLQKFNNKDTNVIWWKQIWRKSASKRSVVTQKLEIKIHLGLLLWQETI